MDMEYKKKEGTVVCMPVHVPHQPTSQERFFDLLKNYPRFAKSWNPERREMLGDPCRWPDGFTKSDQVVAQILVSIWQGNASKPRHYVDITDVAELPAEFKKPILAWLADPFWP